MTTYTTYKKDVKLGPGQTLAFLKGKGYYARGGTTPGVISPSLYSTALALATQGEKPVLDAITSEQNRYDTNAANQAANTKGMYEALAKLLGGSAPAISDAYDKAAGATAGFAKGFSDAEAHIADNENASLTDFLTKQGLSPDQIAAATSQIGGHAAGDVVYGLGGYVPAQGLEREGAAFTAAAENQPAYATGLGLQALTQQAKDQSDEDFQYAQQLAQERGKIPSTAQSLLNDMLTRQQQQESIDIQNAYLNNTQRSTQASITGVDPVTGLPKAGYYVDPKTKQVVPKGYHVDPKTGAIVSNSTTTPSSKAAGKREAAFAQAQPKIFDDAKALVKTVKSTDPLAGLAGHPATVLQKPTRAAASKALFDKYKYLLRYATRSGQPALKKRLNQIIADALDAAGIEPAKPKKTGTFPTPDQIFGGQ